MPKYRIVVEEEYNERYSHFYAVVEGVIERVTYLVTAPTRAEAEEMIHQGHRYSSSVEEVEREEIERNGNLFEELIDTTLEERSLESVGTLSTEIELEDLVDNEASLTWEV